jgi:hypothetical protein
MPKQIKIWNMKLKKYKFFFNKKTNKFLSCAMLRVKYIFPNL